MKSKTQQGYESPFGLIKKQKRDTPKVLKVGRKVEVADKPTTVFDPHHSGYNSLETLTNCPVCLVEMTRVNITTKDGRVVPVNYCLRHRTCLPLPLEQ